MKSSEFLEKNTLVPLENFPSDSAFLSKEAPLNEAQVLLCQEAGRGRRVLDLGSGDGAMLRRLNTQCNETFGIELNERLASRSQQQGLRVKSFDLNDGIPFEDDYFDCVIASDLVDYLFDTRFLFEEVHRVLRRRGNFLFSLPNLNSFNNRLRVLRGDYLRRAGGFPEDRDGQRIRFFNLKKVQELCRFSGMHIQQTWGLAATELKNENSALRWFSGALGRWRPEVSDILIFRAKRYEV